MAKKKGLSSTIDMLLGKGEDTVDVTTQVAEAKSIDDEIAALETICEEDRANETDEERRVREFEAFKLTPMAKLLLQRSCENVAANMGSNTMDESTQKQIQERAALFAACDGNLSDVVGSIVDALGKDDPREASSVIYSTCFAVQKASNFIANLWYRRALDPVADEDLGNGGTVKREDGTAFAADRREELREPPVGLGPDPEGDNVPGFDARGPEDSVIDAYTELHDYLQLMTEAFGWDPDRSMPFCFVTEDNGATFRPITDAMQALDISEVKSRQSRKRREIRQTQALAAALFARRSALRRASN